MQRKTTNYVLLRHITVLTKNGCSFISLFNTFFQNLSIEIAKMQKNQAQMQNKKPSPVHRHLF